MKSKKSWGVRIGKPTKQHPRYEKCLVYYRSFGVITLVTGARYDTRQESRVAAKKFSGLNRKWKFHPFRIK